MKLLKLDQSYVDPAQIIAVDGSNSENTVIWLPYTTSVTVRMKSSEVVELVEKFLKDNA